MTTAGSGPGPLLLSPGRRRRPGVWNAATSGASLRRAQQQVPQVLARLEGGAWSAGPASWTRTGTAVVPLRSPGGDAVLRLRAVGAAALQRETAVLAALTQADLPDAVRPLLPRRLGHLQLDGWTAVVDRAFPGAEGDVRSPDWPALQRQALEVAEALHQVGSQEVTADDRLLAHWVDEPLAAVRWACRFEPGVAAGCAAVAAALRRGLHGRRLRTGWVHGDLWAGNLVVEGPVVTGLVDWDLAAPAASPAHDHLQLLLHARQAASGEQLGATVSGLLRRPDWSPQEGQVLDRLVPAFCGELPDPRVLLLLHWVRYAGAMTARPYTTYSPRAWQLHNVRPVLRAAQDISART